MRDTSVELKRIHDMFNNDYEEGGINVAVIGNDTEIMYKHSWNEFGYKKYFVISAFPQQENENTLGPAYDEIGCHEHTAITSKQFW